MTTRTRRPSRGGTGASSVIVLPWATPVTLVTVLVSLPPRCATLAVEFYSAARDVHQGCMQYHRVHQASLRLAVYFRSISGGNVSYFMCGGVGVGGPSPLRSA